MSPNQQATMQPSPNQLETWTVSKLFDLEVKPQYFIPSYQRGYRWTDKEVEQLLKDVSEFEPSHEAVYYSLQPVVVHEDREVSNKWVVIDGQQRLTTIYLILKALDWDGLPNVCPIVYETRKKSRDFLEKIDTNHKFEERKDNIDFYHIGEAYDTINKWLVKHQQEKDILCDKLLNRSQVIWYEILIKGDEDHQDPKEVFMRFNQGKIPLDQAELIKALFLKSAAQDDADNNEARRNEIARQWDEIEFTLREDPFWYFLMGTQAQQKETKYKNRILLLLEMQTGKNEIGEQVTFNAFVEKNEKELDESWNQIWQNYLILREWYQNRTIYHLIGFLRSRRTSKANSQINSLLRDYKRGTKTSFQKDKLKGFLEKWITEQTTSDKENALDLKQHIENLVKEASYDETKQRDLCQDLLLLYNIAKIEKHEGYECFSFEQFYKNGWSLEHIFPQSKAGSKNSGNDRDQGEADEAIEWVHNIGNLTLLQKRNNSSLGNNAFSDKRNKIIEWEKEGKFIPIGTRMVFQKYFVEENSNDPEKTTIDLAEWRELDFDAYQDDIITTLQNYLNPLKQTS